VAVHLAASVVPRLEAAAVLVVGAGEMAELAVEALRKRGVASISVINRSVGQARDLARRWGAEARPFEALAEELARADVVISSTSAPHAVFHPDLVAAAMTHRPRRSLVMIDIAVPRDVDEAVASIDRVHVYDLDDLQSHLTQSVQERAGEVPRVEAIVEEEVAAFEVWLRGLAVRPLLRDLRRRAELIRRREVERSLRRMGARGDEVREQVEALTRALVNKLLHAPTARLKESALDGEGPRTALAVRELFHLTASPEAEEESDA
jgi:glutamyl-tRNA reductase